MTKFKKLRAWQGHISTRACNGCGTCIDRREFRWRCQERCDWDLCNACYDKHWQSVIDRAKRTQDPARRHELLMAVPSVRRPSPQELEADMAPDTTAGSQDETLSPVERRRQTVLLSTAWLFVAAVMLQGHIAIIGGEHPLIGNPWLVSGITHAGGLLFSRVVAMFAGYASADDQEAVDVQSAGGLGLMFGLECGIHIGILRSPEMASSQNSFLLHPIAMAVAGVLATTESRGSSIWPASGLATLATFLVTPHLLDWRSLEGILPWDLLAGAISVFRWVFTMNVLPRRGGMPPLFYLSAQILVAAAAVGFELAFVTGLLSWREVLDNLLHVSQPVETLALLAGLSIACGVQLALEFRLIQVISLGTFGLLSPCLNIVNVLIGLRTDGIALHSVVGIVLYLAGAFMYFRPDLAVVAASDQDDYQKLGDHSQAKQTSSSHSSGMGQRGADIRSDHGPALHPKGRVLRDSV